MKWEEILQWLEQWGGELLTALLALIGIIVSAVNKHKLNKIKLEEEETQEATKELLIAYLKNSEEKRK